MFEQLASRGQIRSSAPVPIEENVDFTVPDRRNGSAFIVVRITGRTVGTLTLALLASFDGGLTYPATIAQTNAISVATGVGYLRPKGPIPPDLRLVMTPGGGWDGSAGALLRSSGLLHTGQNLG